MTAFDTHFAARAAPRMLGDVAVADDLGRFGEWVNYCPRAGRKRKIRAMVDRNPPGQIAEEQRLIGEMITVEVYNDRTHGIGFAEVDTGGDKIELAIREGDKPQLIGIRKLASRMNSGLTKLELG